MTILPSLESKVQQNTDRIAPHLLPALASHPPSATTHSDVAAYLCFWYSSNSLGRRASNSFVSFNKSCPIGTSNSDSVHAICPPSKAGKSFVTSVSQLMKASAPAANAGLTSQNVLHRYFNGQHSDRTLCQKETGRELTREWSR